MNDFTFFTVKQFARKQPAFKEASLRWQIFNAHANGLDEAGAIRRVGRRVFIVGERYLAWVDAQGATGKVG